MLKMIFIKHLKKLEREILKLLLTYNGPIPAPIKKDQEIGITKKFFIKMN